MFCLRKVLIFDVLQDLNYFCETLQQLGIEFLVVLQVHLCDGTSHTRKSCVIWIITVLAICASNFEV